jgi:hypothetical protein
MLDDMTSPLLQFADAFILRTHDDQLLTLSEGFIKVRCIETALSLGWTIQEGAGQSRTHAAADYAFMETEKNIKWERRPRRLLLDEGSSDIAIVEPFELLLEIKARPDRGTKSQAQFQQMDADVARIASNPKCVFFFIFDPRIYRSFSGEKIEMRGRNAIAAQWFVRNFPKLETIPLNRWLHIEAIRDTPTTPISMIAQRCAHSLSEETILVLGWRRDASFIRPHVEPCDGERAHQEPGEGEADAAVGMSGGDVFDRQHTAERFTRLIA